MGLVQRFRDSVSKIIRLDIVRVFSFTSLATLIKMISGFLSVKIVSVIIGPEGIALIGQLNNFSSIIMNTASGGITTGVTKYIAEYDDDEELRKSYIGTAVKFTLVSSVICGLLLIALSSVFSKVLLLDRKYSFVFVIFGITLIFYTFNTLLMAIINGYHDFSLYLKISIITSIVGLLLSYLLVIPFGVSGALINAVTSQSLVFIVSFLLLKHSKCHFLKRDYLFARFDKNKAFQYLKFSAMLLVSAVCLPITQLVLRNHIINNFTMQAAGNWEGMNRLSGMYLMVITSSFGVYYLPKLSALDDPVLIKREILTAYKLILPFIIIIFPLIYLCREIVIKIMFAKTFVGMSDLVLWQLIGDFLKIASWLIAFLMPAKSMVKLFIISEIGASIIYIVMAFFFSTVLHLGLIGILMGYISCYVAYSIFVFLFIWKKI